MTHFTRLQYEPEEHHIRGLVVRVGTSGTPSSSLVTEQGKFYRYMQTLSRHIPTVHLLSISNSFFITDPMRNLNTREIEENYVNLTERILFILQQDFWSRSDSFWGDEPAWMEAVPRRIFTSTGSDLPWAWDILRHEWRSIDWSGLPERTIHGRPCVENCLLKSDEFGDELILDGAEPAGPISRLPPWECVDRGMMLFSLIRKKVLNIKLIEKILTANDGVTTPPNGAILGSFPLCKLDSERA